MKQALLFLSTSLLVFSCSFGEKNDQVKSVIEADPIPKFVDYEVRRINEQYGPCTGDTTTQKCLIIQVEFPEITGLVSKEIKNKLNSYIQNDILGSSYMSEQPTSFSELEKELETDYLSMLKEFPDYKNPWVLEINSDVLYQDSLYISVASTVYSYTGGAHPNSGQVYRSYDLRTGEPVTLDDLLIEGYETDLNESAEIEFRMDKEIPPQTSLEDSGYWFEEDNFSLNNNFAIIRQSLIFYFNPYEIAPYAMGPTELELKLTDFVDLIKDGSVIEDLKY